VIRLFATALIAVAGAQKMENIQFMTSDANMTCAQNDFKLELDFDGTGETVAYKWNGIPGQSPVTWNKNVATFGLDDAQNGPFNLVFKDAHFYFQNVLCVETF
jgi:hypothetical protein